MNVTIRDFFEKYILPLHARAEAGKASYLNQEFKTSETTYFQEVQFPQFLQLNNISLENEQELISYLNKFWEKEPDLLRLIPELATLAFTLKKENIEQSAELSPFLYVMF